MIIDHKQTVLALCIVALHCGDSEQRNGTGDGLAPYKQEQALEMCFDGKQVWPMEAIGEGPTGLCAPVTRESRRCMGDSECGPREACLCGQCRLKLCQFSDECREGQVCAGSPSRCTPRCSADSDCSDLEVCLQGACVPSCGDAEDCAYGELCLVGQCAALGCRETSAVCSAQEICNLQRQAADLTAPSAILLNDGVTLYVIAQMPVGSAAIWRGISHDAIRFVLQPIQGISLDPTALPSRLGVQQDQHGTWLYFAVDNQTKIVRTFAADGQHFGDPQQALAAANDWEGGKIHSPALVTIDSQAWLFYANGAKSQIGAAVEQTDGTWQRVDANPLLSAETVESASSLKLWQQLNAITDPWPIVYQSALGRRELRIYFSANGRERLGDDLSALASSNYSIGVVRSELPDPSRTFTLGSYAYNPILARRRNLDELEERQPTVLLTPKGGLMYFSANGRIELAINDGTSANLEQ